MHEFVSYNLDAVNYHINDDGLDAVELKDSYQNNTPFPHIVIPKAVDPNMLSDIAEEVNNFQPQVKKSFYGSIKKFTPLIITKLFAKK